MMKLYGFDVSTPANKVRYVANYLGIEFDYQRLDAFKGENQTDEHRKRHPAGKVPAIIDGDFVLFESNAIIRYLARKVQSPIYPDDIEQGAIVDQWMDFSSIHIGNAMNKVFGNRVVFPIVGIDVDERSLEDGLGFLDKFLPVIEQQLQGQAYLTGEEITLADFTLISTLDPVELAKINISIYPKIVAYRNRLHREDFYQACHGAYGEGLGQAA